MSVEILDGNVAVLAAHKKLALSMLAAHKGEFLVMKVSRC